MAYSRADLLWKNYGLTIEMYNEMFSQQKGECAICGIHQSKLNKSLSVDHNHDSGEVRGLLCHRCNTALGMMDENLKSIAKMIEYLELHNQKEI